MSFQWFWGALKRRKTFEDDPSKTKLARVLTLLDLTGLGVGSTLGLGVYVLAGSVAKTVAGPAVCISFIVAAVASAFAGVCYAEFAVRVPKAGSAYVYSYVTVGEFIAFTIGWNLILEYVIGTASVAKGLSNYVDVLANNAIKNALKSVLPMNISFLSDYADVFAFCFVMAVTVLLAMGVKDSTRMNNIFTVLNLATITIVIVAGITKVDTHFWAVSYEEIPEEYRKDAGTGGFMPFGVAGIMAGAAKCFFGFVGFDCVATTGEEAIDPHRNIPLSIAISLIIVFFCYFSIATVLTMMVPYYLQDPDAPFPKAFDMAELHVVKWIVTIGAVFALCTTLLGALFPLPRVLYAMGSDGVLFRWLSKVNQKTLTPIVATILSGVFSGIMAALFKLEQLIDMMSIGTLMAYTIVAISVLILRFEEESKSKMAASEKIATNTFKGVLKQMFNMTELKFPGRLSYNIVQISTLAFSITSLCLWMVLAQDHDSSLVPLSVIFALMAVLLWFIIQRQPQEDVSNLIFKVPLVPTIPCLSITMNIYLMVQLDTPTWIRFCVWLVIGYAIYFGYGIRKSSENLKAKINSNKLREQNNLVNNNGGLNKAIDDDSAPSNVNREPTNGNPESATSKPPVSSLKGIENNAYVPDDKQITVF